MLKKEEFEKLLRDRQTLVIDGALATELEVRGKDLNHPLWSARILKDDPGSIQQVHEDYFLAGADVAITASYQAGPQGLLEHFGMDEDSAKAVIVKSVRLAQDARIAAYRKGASPTRNLLVAGSVGPYGAYLADGSEYRGDYVRRPEEFKDFHRPRIQALIDAEVDILALETMPSFMEIQALLELLEVEFPHTIAWLSCTSKSSSSLSDGTPWKTVLNVVNQHGRQIVAFGINCVPMNGVIGTLRHLSKSTQLPLVCYPNSGETWDAGTKTWHGQRPDDSLSSEQRFNTKDWTAHGVKLIGGCCRTGPAFIQAVDNDLELQRPKLAG